MRDFIIIREENIADHICFLRGLHIILDFNLASLYGVETRVLKQAVRRNIKRFPEDFMFELSREEINFIISQNAIPSRKHLGGAIPYAFTEQGIAMLSGVLNSDRAIQANIAISSQKELVKKITDLEKKHDNQFSLIFSALKQLIRKENEPRKRIGYRNYDENNG